MRDTDLPRFCARAPRVERLDNGLTVCLLESRQAPLVVTALWYRAGARHEPRGRDGLAHFLEHMMFKGSPAYPEGEIDRLTQALGGSNNAFTSHDATAYYFGFAGDRWSEALRIEADRMRALDLEPSAVDRERQVILEELALYEEHPWDALELEVCRALLPRHPYGRPVVGSRQALLEIGVEDLEDFHRRFYVPDNAVLVLAGALDDSAFERVARAFDDCAVGRGRQADSEPPEVTAGTTRVTRRGGRVDRLLIALPAPAADAEDYAAVRVLTTLLGTGRTSRLHGRLVEDLRLAVWASAELTETFQPGLLTVAVESVPGAPPDSVERGVLEELARLRRDPPDPEEIDRARRILVADRVFGSERVEQQAMIAGQALAVFDLDYPDRHLRAIASCGRPELLEAARRFFDPRSSGVIGWSLAADPSTQ